VNRHAGTLKFPAPGADLTNQQSPGNRLLKANRTPGSAPRAVVARYGRASAPPRSTWPDESTAAAADSSCTKLFSAARRRRELWTAKHEATFSRSSPDPRLITASEALLQPTFMNNINLVFRCHKPIYFNSASQHDVLQHFYNNRPPNLYSFLGHSESLFGIDRDFQLVYFPGSGGSWKNSTPRREL
jgi:hypothetical protein